MAKIIRGGSFYTPLVVKVGGLACSARQTFSNDSEPSFVTQ